MILSPWTTSLINKSPSWFFVWGDTKTNKWIKSSKINRDPNVQPGNKGSNGYLSIYLSIYLLPIDGSMLLPKELGYWKMQTASSRIWARLNVSIFCDNNRYANNTLFSVTSYRNNDIVILKTSGDTTNIANFIYTQAVIVSILLYRCTTWTLNKRMEKKLDGNYTRLLGAILNKSWRQHPTKQQLYGYLPPITKTIQVRRTRHAGHCWRSRDELLSDVFLWTPSHGDSQMYDLL